MSAKSFWYLEEYIVLSETAEVTAGAEPAEGLCVDLDGAVSVNARGVVFNSREGFVSLVVSGKVPAKVADGQSIAKGQAVSSDANGELIVATATTDVIGYATEAIASASSDYITIIVQPKIYIA